MQALQKETKSRNVNARPIKPTIKSQSSALRRRMALVTLVSLIVGIILIGTMFHQQRLIYKQDKKELALTKQVQKLSKEKESLNQQVKLLNDEAYVAELARKNFFFSKDNEIIFSIPE